MTLEIKTEEREGKIIRVIDLGDRMRIRLIQSNEHNYYLEIGLKSTDNQFWLRSGRSIAIQEDEIDAIIDLLQQAHL